MAKRGVETLVGLFVLLGLLALVFLAVRAANLASFGSGESYRLQARFDNIGGLKERAPVRSAGVTVGRVRSIGLDPKTYQGVVAMEIEKEFKFPRDTSAQILTSGLLGDQYIGLSAGADEKMLAAGDTVRMTQSAVVLENLIGQFLFSKTAEAGAVPASAASSAPKR
jgi:phospholipid/cholesterol/gamma-HCH transport system substrate-binding protein